MYLVDTDVMIDIQRSYAPALAWFASLGELLNISGIDGEYKIQQFKNDDFIRSRTFPELQLTVDQFFNPF